MTRGSGGLVALQGVREPPVSGPCGLEVVRDRAGAEPLALRLLPAAGGGQPTRSGSADSDSR
ncbi:hypothetical protein BRC63_09940 [Halobacteriales archaeon QH_10_70_21]|nr:MAG: hypothetical protein BRC63_09940 [Halobacteriales archaeon QH_10_70_21]